MKILIILLFLLSTSITSAHENKALAEQMKEMGVHFKVIVDSFKKGVLTEQDLTATENLQLNISNASLLYPEKASTDTKKVLYHRLMAELGNNALHLEIQIKAALESEAQNLSQVGIILKAMNEARKLAHDEFKNDDGH